MERWGSGSVGGVEEEDKNELQEGREEEEGNGEEKGGEERGLKMEREEKHTHTHSILLPQSWLVSIKVSSESAAFPSAGSEGANWATVLDWSQAAGYTWESFSL